MKIVAIVGSPRLSGNTSYLTDQALGEAKRLGVETSKIVLAQHKIDMCQGHDRCQELVSCPQEDDMRWIVQELYEADGIILASPVYFHNVTAQMKAFIDRNKFYRRHQWRLKANHAGIIVVAGSVGVEETANVLTLFITMISNIPAERIRQVHGFANTASDIRSNAAAIEQARRLGKDLAEELLIR